MRSGYDQEYEDELFEQIEWPRDGYRLFDIGHFVGDRDWFDGVWESNCLFAPRKLLEQVGGFDEGFSMAGGGYTNLDIYERLGGVARRERREHPRRGLVPPGARRHDDQPDATRPNGGSACSRTASTTASCAAGVFSGPEKPIHYVGGFQIETAKRSRGRRMTAKAFAVDDVKEGADGPAPQAGSGPRRPEGRLHRRVLAQPRVDADEVARARRGRRRRPTSSRTRRSSPRSRPDWIIETGTGDGGRALFLASLCDLLGHGRSCRSTPARPATCRNIRASPTSAGGRTATKWSRKVRALVGDDPNGLVVLGTRGARHAHAPGVRRVQGLRRGRLVRDHGAHGAERVPRRCVVRSRTARGRAPHPAPRTATSWPTASARSSH